MIEIKEVPLGHGMSGAKTEDGVFRVIPPTKVAGHVRTHDFTATAGSLTAILADIETTVLTNAIDQSQ